MLNRLISVAPMMDWTDRHDRYFLRIISPNALLYTEMITANALIYGDTQRLLQFHPAEHPVALQLGGSDPDKLAQAALIGQDAGYDEINLNVGCPSDRVQSGRFGACLMFEPNLVAECIQAMASVVKIPVTVKCRIGVDDNDSYAELVNFISTISAFGCGVFILHARKAWLKGLSPKENREIPPLRYDVVRQIKQDFPSLSIIVNGGIKTSAAASEHLQWADGVMIGREAYTNPYFLADLENIYFPGTVQKLRHEVIQALIPYVEEQLALNVKLSNMTRHILGLFQGQKGARSWRRFLSENAHQSGNGIEVIINALEKMDEHNV